MAGRLDRWVDRYSRHASACRMFGKNQIHNIIRQNHTASANEILSNCLDTLDRYIGDRTPEDDVTMIVIKMIDD